MTNISRQTKKRENAMATQQQQMKIQVAEGDTTPGFCEACRGQHFDACFKIGVMSAIHPKNPTHKPISVNIPVLVCRSCGHEYGQPVIKNGKAD